MQSRFNAPVWAFVLVLAAYVPLAFPSVTSWPPVGFFLLAALALTIVGFTQERLFGSVLMLVVLFVAGPVQMFIVPFMHAASFGRDQQHTALSAQLAAGENATTATAASGGGNVAQSQQAAVRKYPALAVKNSAMNVAFLARYNAWKQRDDPRLRQANWPELLADDCAANP